MLIRKSIVWTLALACGAGSLRISAEDAKPMSEKALLEKLTPEMLEYMSSWETGT